MNRFLQNFYRFRCIKFDELQNTAQLLFFRNQYERSDSMKYILTILFTITAINVAADTLTLTGGLFQSDARLELDNQTKKGKLSGLSLKIDYNVSKDLTLNYEYILGEGNLNAANTRYNFYESSLHLARNFRSETRIFDKWSINYMAGVGISQKSSEYENKRQNKTQQSILLGASLENSRGSFMRLKGTTPVDAFKYNKLAIIEVGTPISNSANLFASYRNHSSKIDNLRHCGADYFVGIGLKY